MKCLLILGAENTHFSIFKEVTRNLILSQSVATYQGLFQWLSTFLSRVLFSENQGSPHRAKATRQYFCAFEGGRE